MQSDEFFPDDPIAPDLIEFDQLTVPGKVFRKKEFEHLAASLNAILLNENSALEAYVRIKNVAEILDVALAQIREQAIQAISGTRGEVFGVTAQLKPLPRKWQYDDAEVRKLEAEKLAVEARLKARKKYLENLKVEVADTTTGEIIRPARCIAEGLTIQVTF